MVKFGMNQVDIMQKQTMKFGDGVLCALRDTKGLKIGFLCFFGIGTDILLCLKFT